MIEFVISLFQPIGDTCSSRLADAVPPSALPCYPTTVPPVFPCSFVNILSATHGSFQNDSRLRRNHVLIAGDWSD